MSFDPELFHTREMASDSGFCLEVTDSDVFELSRLGTEETGEPFYSLEAVREYLRDQGLVVPYQQILCYPDDLDAAARRLSKGDPEYTPEQYRRTLWIWLRQAVWDLCEDADKWATGTHGIASMTFTEALQYQKPVLTNEQSGSAWNEGWCVVLSDHRIPHALRIERLGEKLGSDEDAWRLAVSHGVEIDEDGFLI